MYLLGVGSMHLLSLALLIATTLAHLNKPVALTGEASLLDLSKTTVDLTSMGGLVPTLSVLAVASAPER